MTMMNIIMTRTMAVGGIEDCEDAEVMIVMIVMMEMPIKVFMPVMLLTVGHTC